MSTAIGCGFSCKSGFVKNTVNRTCNIPDLGKYADSSGDEQSCNNPTGATGGFKEFLTNTAAVATATGCGFSCNVGFVKKSVGRTCNIPDQGKYADNEVEKDCSPITGDTGGFNKFTVNTGAVSTATGCGFSCNTGFMKTGRTCNFPSLGKYVNNQGIEASCNSNSITIQGTAVATWIAGASATDATCPFSCSTGFVKSGRACNIPRKGHYADNGVETDCSPITGGGFDDFAVNTGAVSAADGCGFACNAGFVKISADRTCDIPDTGKYADNGVAKDCSPITEDIGGFDAFAVNTGAVSAADGCDFSCNAGFLKTGRACNFPSTGNYVNAGNTEASCDSINSITTEGTATATWIAGAAATAATCPFSCSAGYAKDTSAGECKYPTQGTYADAQGAEVSCTDITGITGFAAWVSGAAVDIDSCPFSCDSGYTVSGRTCRKRPEMLALGRDTSRILFSNGEVEAWGKVSASPWRSHIKENLGGGHTPQALVSGWFHECIILKNGNLNHGSLMCWGQNGDGQLGVGDTNPRSTPTPVTATILGDAGGGVPNTVKSVAAGHQHTCAILNDDTVVCWGRNNFGQIGGVSDKLATLSGMLGDPLSGGTARRISAGENHTCAILTTDSSVKCWGDNANSQTGSGTPSLGNGKTATKIALGDASSCAILNDGGVKCWGLNSPNLGSNTATKITLGYGYGCVLLNDKTVKCWGWGNSYGRRGGGTSGSDRVLRGTQGDPLGGQTAIQIAAGSEHTCAIMESDHSVKCWGKNIDTSANIFYGQIVGEVPMAGGSDGTGTSTGETATLTTASTPTATALAADANGKVCALLLDDATLTHLRVVKFYSTPLTYNTGSSTTTSDAIDNLIAVIGPTVNVAGTINVTLAKKDNDKIEATVNNAILDGMTLTIYHTTDDRDCSTSSVGTPITLSGASDAAQAEGLWIISQDYTGSGDKTVNLDSVHIDLGNAPLTKELIADEIITKVTDGSWAGKQYKDLPYLATKLDGSSSTTDDCPANDFCVLFERVFKGTEGNYGIPFGDRDYEH